MKNFKRYAFCYGATLPTVTDATGDHHEVAVQYKEDWTEVHVYPNVKVTIKHPWDTSLTVSPEDALLWLCGPSPELESTVSNLLNCLASGTPVSLT